MRHAGCREPVEEILDPEGYVYFIQAEDGGPIKIGWARDVRRRLADLQSGCPLWLTVRRKIAADDPRALEGALHTQFAHSRLHGEWFAPTPDLLSFVRSARSELDLGKATLRVKRAAWQRGWDAAQAA